MSDTVDSVYPFIGRRRSHQITIALAVLLPFALTVLAVVLLWGSHVTWLDLSLLLVGQIIAGLGISVGFHRLLAHGALRAPAPVRFLLLLAGITSLEGSPASWAATHRRHHALSDKPGDPHSPLHGFWHAHMGWLLKGNLVHDGPAVERIMRDPVVRFLERTNLFWVVLSFLVPATIGLAVFGTWGAFWQAMLWGGAVRVFLVHHTTWSINSICHMWGARPYEVTDVSRNNAIFGFLGYGEGWHNNHHAFPKSAFLGHRWYQFDLGKYLIVTLRALRLVDKVHVPTKAERLAKRRERRSPTKAPGVPA